MRRRRGRRWKRTGGEWGEARFIRMFGNGMLYVSVFRATVYMRCMVASSSSFFHRFIHCARPLVNGAPTL